ncbi:DUF5615 family PIN-like protein [Hymenobacter weizhouensis]|uniref:DUF5615 family PIN-like protein n=1 Tax=Hymenobacter sp. YIM 151500-1 TaxID=2987689 RepID=UPI0039B6F502
MKILLAVSGVSAPPRARSAARARHGLDSSPDTSISRYAQREGFHLLTKDEDFTRLVLTQGFPSKVIVVTNAQVPVQQLAAFLQTHLPHLKAWSW